MALPLSIPVAVAAFSAFSSFQQTTITNRQKRAQARVAELNADLALMEGDLALKTAFLAEAESRRRTKQLIGQQRATMAATGFAVGEGSFADIIETSAVLGDMEAAVIIFEGQVIKARKTLEAQSLRAEAKTLRESQADPGLAGLGAGLGSFTSLARF
jgi:hypothetical protein